MHLTSLENEAWRAHADFFEPGGTLDIPACQAYLHAHMQRNFHANHLGNGKVELLLALLKKVPNLDEARDAFCRLYENMRKELPQLQSLMQECAQEQPQTFRTWMRQASLCSNMTSQILLIRDVKEWLPLDDVIEYTSPELLKIKPTTFVKRFSPDVQDMVPMLGAGMQMQNHPEYAPLGRMIVQGVFTAMYGKESTNESGMEEKYCARAAFSLLNDSNAPIDPEELLGMVALRYKGPSLVPDALAFTHACLSSQSSPYTQARGLDVLNAVLNKHNEEPSMEYANNFCRVYTALLNLDAPTFDPRPWLARIEKACTHYIAVANKNDCPARTLLIAAEHAPALVRPMLDALLTRNDDQDCTQLIAHVYLGGRVAMYHGLYPEADGYLDAFVDACEKRITPAQMTHALAVESERFRALYQDPKKWRPEAEAGSRYNALSHFSRQKISTSMLSHLKDSSVVAQWTLAYLGAEAVLESPSNTDNSTMPELDQIPLPFLAKLYPEHSSTWNVMQKALLQKQPSDAQTGTNVYQQLFDIFAQTFLPSSPTFAQAHAACVALDINWQEYIATMCAQAHAPMLKNLDPTLFDFSL